MTPQQAFAADSVRRVLHAVLSDPEFGAREPSQVSSLLDRALSWVWDLFAKVVRWLFRGVDFRDPGWDLARWIVTLAVAAIGIWLLVRLTRIGVRAIRSGAGGGGPDHDGNSAPVRSASEWEALAREASGEQRWRDASLALYHAVLLRLAEAGRLKPNASKTPGDYRREAAVASLPGDLYAAVLDFLRSFERVAFARTLPVAADYDRLRELAESLGAHV